VEYRVAAYLGQDEALISEFVKNPDLDFHQFCADIAHVSRSEAKTVNFGILYGMGKKSLASLLRVSEYEAERILAKITSAVPSMKQAFLAEKEFGVKHGYIQNKMGRVVKVPDHKAYAALNYSVQGFCGDIMRAAMLRVSKLIKERSWPIKICLSVHDELVYDIPTCLVAEAAPVLSKCMCDVPEVSPMPITCDIEVGPNWADMLKLKDWLKANPQYTKGA
jgi:DNA polymerase-1